MGKDTRMHEEVHLPCSLDGFNVRLELVPNTRGHLKRCGLGAQIDAVP